jgi:hypothetical protein
MKFRLFSPVLAASLALTLGAAACGSSKSASSISHAVSTVAASKTSAAKAKVKAKASTSAAQVKAKASTSAAKAPKTTYKAGEFCSSTNESAYKAQNLTCANGHLKSTSTTKSTST